LRDTSIPKSLPFPRGVSPAAGSHRRRFFQRKRSSTIAQCARVKEERTTISITPKGQGFQGVKTAGFHGFSGPPAPNRPRLRTDNTETRENAWICTLEALPLRGNQIPPPP
jgi:hypothetical protein